MNRASVSLAVHIHRYNIEDDACGRAVAERLHVNDIDARGPSVNTVSGANLTARDAQRRRTSLYRCAIALSCIDAADGIFMAWALLNGAYASLGYGKLSYLPVFLPAFVADLVVSTIYVHGLLRRGWTARKAEWLSFSVDVSRSRLT